MSFKAKDGNLDRLNGMGQRFKVALGEAAEMGGQLLVRTSQTGQRSGSKSGRIYGSHQASAPGEYSAPRSYELLNSTGYEATSREIRFGVEAEHGVYQEVGTRKMAARPNLGNSVEEQRDELGRILGEVTFRRLLGK